MADKITLKDEKIVERWSILIGNGEGQAEKVYSDTENLVRLSKAPGMGMERVRVRPSWLKGLFGVERAYLMVTNESLKDYRLLIGARDYGNNLDVSWYLTCEPKFFKNTFSRLLSRGGLDMFYQQDLNAYATLVHHCLRETLEKIMTDLGQDTSKLGYRSKGFLGIS